ncbi:ABC transporter permease subunit [Streptomyces sp. MCAF7]
MLFLFLGFADEIGQFGALVIALALFNGSVLAEVIRAGILAVPRGQGEAASALGLRKHQITALILLPQAVRSMLPSIISQCVVALKDTALGFVIAYEDLVRTGQLIYTGYHNILPTAFVIGALYIAMNTALSTLATRMHDRSLTTTNGA